MTASSLMNRVRALLDEKGLSQASFARKIDVSPQALSAWLSGRNRPGVDEANVRGSSGFPFLVNNGESGRPGSSIIGISGLGKYPFNGRKSLLRQRERAIKCSRCPDDSSK